MKLILFWLCITSANSITTPLWSIYANNNFHPPYFQLYPTQQVQNDFQISQNSPTFGLSSHHPLFQPNQNVRFPQVLSAANSQKFVQNLPYPNQPVQNSPNLLYIRQNQGFAEYNPTINNRWIRPAKNKLNKKTRSNAKKKSKPNDHSVPVIYVDANPERHNYRHKFENTVESAVSSEHEVPQEIPTKPIYPGEGQWAKRGKKHRPHVTKHKFKDLEDSTQHNMGHTKADFEKKKNKFKKGTGHVPAEKHTTYTDYQDDYYDDTSTEEFVPYKTYSQVRHSESEKHFPFSSPEDERLKESITDSKTHTVYTEEGYEDSAYDHADQEKNSDSTEVYDDAKKEKVNKPKQKEFGKKVFTPGLKSESVSNSDHEISSIRPMDLLSVDQRINSRFETTTLTQPEDHEHEEYEENLNAKPSDVKTESSKNVDENLNHQSLNTYNHPYIFAPVSRQKQNLTGQEPFLPTNKPDANIVNTYSEYSKSPATHFIPSKSLEGGLIVNAKNLNRKKRMVTENVNQNKSITVHNTEKYPYYNLKSVEENSPLRYSENLNKVPDKKQGVMAFYDQADQVECEEVESDVNPISSRVGKSENISNSEDVQAPSPRLEKLGDKIDCFKAKYFGENPLDNPLFKEDLIDTPRTIFENFSPSRPTNSSKSQEKTSVSSKNEADEISHMIQDYINYEVTENIEDNLDENDSMIERIKETVAEDSRKEKVSDIILGRYLREDPTPNLKYLEDSKKLTDRHDSDDVPESSPYVMKRRRKPYRSSYRRTSVPPVIYNKSYKPPHRPFSEVHYKDEIKPSEQLNVFADVINNIKTATKYADSVSSDIQTAPTETTSTPSRSRRRKLPSRNYKVKTTTNLPFEIGVEDVLNSYQLTSTAGPYKYNNFISKDPRNYVNPIGESFSKIDSFKNKVESIRENEVQPNTSFWTPMAKDKNNKISSLEVDGINEENFIPSNHRIEDTASKYKVHGLLPPREIHIPRPFSLPDSEATSNNFNVIGMRPPPIKRSKQRQSHVKKRRVAYPHRLRIVKRSARRGYSEIRRQSKNIEEIPEQQEEEEYVPHRPKTYRYDVEKGRIIYDKKPESEEAELESYEYVDVVEEVTSAKPKKEKEKKEERVLKFPDKPPEGPTYVDFINQLKSNPNYHEIPDPKPTEKTTTLMPSTETPISTTEPEFLSILSKVRSDASYKTIEDENKSKAKKEKVAEAKEEASEIEEEEEVLKDVQNSPGGQINSFASPQLEIFDISDYLPKVKNYSPSTNVDTSKYKSIERVTITRHNSDSRYSSEDEPEGDEERNRNAATTSSQSLTLQVPTSTNPPTAPLPKTDKPEGQVQSRKTTSRGRRRSTTTQLPIEEATTQARHSRGRSRFRSTTSSPTDEIRESTRRRRNLQRKYNKNSIPRNHKSHYSAVEPDGSMPKVKEIVTRAITIDTLKETNITNIPSENTTEKTDDVEIFKKFDKAQKHGGNYKYKKVEIRVSQGTNYVPPTAYEIEDSEEIKRLTDIVPKPFAFYSDPKLPSRINSLTEANNRRESAGEGLKDELQFFEEAVLVNSESATRKPNFIKDPSKRLYFYAPI